MVSSELLWQCIKRNNSFVRKFNGVTFTAEPLNLINKNTLKYSGLANKHPIGLERGGELHSYIALTTTPKRGRKMRKPLKARRMQKFCKSKASIAKVLKIVAAHRPDLINTANRKMKKLIHTGNDSRK